MAYPLLWPDAPVWNQRSTFFFVSIGMSTGAAFMKEFIQTKIYSPLGDQVLILTIIVGLLTALLCLFVPANQANLITQALSGIILLMIVSICIQCWRRGSKVALYFLFSWMCLPLAALGTFLRDFAILPINFITLNISLLGATSEMFLLSFALAARLNHLKRNSEKLNTTLEKRVLELDKQNQKIQTLNQTLSHQISNRSSQLAEMLTRAVLNQKERIKLHLGDIVGQRYKLIRKLGSGGMGAVYEVYRLSDRKHFALKVLLGQGDPIAMSRLVREAQMLSLLSSPHIVQVIDVDFTEEGILFIAMELVKGHTLSGYVGRLSNARQTCDLLLQIALGLDAIHKKDIIHRDLKPSNIMITENKEHRLAKIVDFGISGLFSNSQEDSLYMKWKKEQQHEASEIVSDDSSFEKFSKELTSAETLYRQEPTENPSNEHTCVPMSISGSKSHPYSKLTQAGYLLGTPNYMAPECVQENPEWTTASDVFSFGVIAFQVLTGKKPFSHNMVELKIKNIDFTPPTQLDGEGKTLPTSTQKVLLDCLCEDPQQRPDAETLVRVLKETDQ